jgi:2-phosphosulfolactate phosphatase
MPAETSALEVLFTPAEFAALAGRDLSKTACVVFDVLRATSTIVAALANGAREIIPVAEIDEALKLHSKMSDALLAAERDGVRIRAGLTGSIDFDLGNSPREFVPAVVGGKRIILSTTNGSRALRACGHGGLVLAAAFLNLSATAAFLQSHSAEQILLICSGTGEEAAYEDVLAAGALAGMVWPKSDRAVADSANVARQIYELNQHDLLGAMRQSRNGTRLLGMPELRDDVAWCLRQDALPLVARMENGKVTRVELAALPARI